MVGPEFDTFPEIHQLPTRMASLPPFGSSFQMVAATSGYVLCVETDDVAPHLAARRESNASHKVCRFEIEPGFHRNSVMIRDFERRKLGIGHINDSFDARGLILADLDSHSGPSSWFVLNQQRRNGLVLESLNHEYVLSVHPDGEPFVAHKMLIANHPQFEGFEFREVNHSEYKRHDELLKNAARKWHDNVLHV